MAVTTMHPEEYKWRIQLVKDRYAYLNLTFEQAEKVFLHEEEKANFAKKHHFTFWEEGDYDLFTFHKILNQAQFSNYVSEHQEHVARYEKDLVNGDSPRTTDMDFYNAHIDFYTHEFLPDFYKDEFMAGYLDFPQETAKVGYLKEEYKKFLNEQKKELLTTHFRHDRNFKPNQLEWALLHHKLMYYLPNYEHFKAVVDKPTKAICLFLEKKFRLLTDYEETTIKEKFELLETFNHNCFEKYYGSKAKSPFIIKGPELTPAEKRSHHVMTILLLDKDHYGCN